MDESFRVRKEKVEARMKLRELLASGQVRPEQVSIAASALSCHPGTRLGVDHVELSDYEFPDED